MKRILVYLFLGVCAYSVVYSGCINKSSQMKENISNIDTTKFSCCIGMDVVPNEYASDDSRITLVIKNNCSSPATYGYGYSLEFYNSQKNQWEEIVYEDINIVFDLIAIELNANCSDTVDIPLYLEYHKFIPGRYKVRKQFEIENEKIDLDADFFIKDKVE